MLNIITGSPHTPAYTMTDLAAQYQMKTDLEHILHNGEMYIGPVAPIDAHMWVYDDAMGSNRIEEYRVCSGSI